MSEFLPIPRTTAENIVEMYNDALAEYHAAFHALTEAQVALSLAESKARQCSPGINDYNFRHIHEMIGLTANKLPDAETFIAGAKRLLTINCWSWIIQNTKLESLLDHTEKEKLRNQLMFVQEKRRQSWGDTAVSTKDDASIGMPDITIENIMMTLRHFSASAPEMMARGIATTFAALDRRFKSHDGFKIGSRIILTNAFSSWGGITYGKLRDTLIDVERVFTVLDGRLDGTFTNGITAIQESRRGVYNPQQSYIETEYFKIRGFCNGNIHLWFKRDDLVEKINQILGKYYGEVLPDNTEEATSADPLENKKRELARNFGFFPSPPAVVDVIEDQACLHTESSLLILEPSAGTGNIAYMAATPRTWRNWGSPQQPEGVTQHKVECVEVQRDLVESLYASGKFINVRCMDFLDIPPEPKFDRVLMNPPFDRERDIDHVVHALKFLKPGGRLVSVMSAGTRFRETKKTIAFQKLVEKHRGTWRDLPERSFSDVGTNVNTTILVIDVK